MARAAFDRLFETDQLTKRERVERTLHLQPVDRVALHDQVSFNPGVIALYTGRDVRGFDYTYQEIGQVIRRTLDACFPPAAPRGSARETDADGFVIQRDQWTTWTVSRPFADVAGARAYLLHKMRELRQAPFDPDAERARHRQRMQSLQQLIGDTVIIDYSISVGFCDCWSRLGLELFILLYDEDPQVVHDYIELHATRDLRRLHAIADPALSPVVLIAEDYATKHGPIFSPAFLRRVHFPWVAELARAWHEHGLKVLYHSDGNYRSTIPDLIACGVDGFYCLEPGVGMDIVGLKQQWPGHVWAGGVDGVDLLERGAPEQVAAEVRRHILETGALRAGGMFVGSSSEINPPIRPENYRAMVEAAGSLTNPGFAG